jgi:hypothetical protein
MYVSPDAKSDLITNVVDLRFTPLGRLTQAGVLADRSLQVPSDVPAERISPLAAFNSAI